MVRSFWRFVCIALCGLWIFCGCSSEKTTPVKPEMAKEPSLSKAGEEARRVVVSYEEAARLAKAQGCPKTRQQARSWGYTNCSRDRVEDRYQIGECWWIAKTWVLDVTPPYGDPTLFIGGSNETSPCSEKCSHLTYYSWIHSSVTWRWWPNGSRWYPLTSGEVEDNWVCYLELSGRFSKPAPWEAKNVADHYFESDGGSPWWFIRQTATGSAAYTIDRPLP